MKKSFLFGFFLLLFANLSLQAANYYWIGGSGNWSDTTHWVKSSGGSVYHSNVPGANDNVIFDSLSFTGAGQVVTLDAGNFLCRSMDWTEARFNPTLSGALADTLEVYGSLSFASVMNNNFLGDLIIFSSTAQDSLSPNGQSIKGNLIFNGTGTYQLKGTLNCLKNIYVLRGTLNTNGKSVNCVNFNALSTSTRGLILGASVLTVSGSGNVWDAGSSGFTLNAGSSRIVFAYTGNNNVLFNAGGSGASYNVVSFLSSKVRFLNSGTFDSLAFVPGAEVILEAQKNQILNKLIALGTCGNPIALKSSGTIPSTITNGGGTAIVCNYLRLSLITKAGAGSITANNSIIELAPCANWIMNPPTGSQNFYWIGGTGNWNDPAHWSLSSGGVAGTCIPGPDDNVIFNAASGFAANNPVSITQNAYCNNMSWLGVLPNPVLAGSNVNLYIKGNVLLNTNMNMTFSGGIYFTGNSVQQITTNGTSFSADIYVQKTGGEVSLNDAFSSSKKIILLQGNFHTQGETLTCAAFLTSGSLAKTITINNSQVFLTGFGTVWDMISPAVVNTVASTITCNNATNNLVVFKGGGLVYHHLLLNNSYSSILASNTFSRLFVTPGSSLTLQSGTTQSIDSLRASGNCNLPVTLESSSMYGAPAVISKSGHTVVNLSFVYLRNVTAATSAPVRIYNALNAYGQYTTTGWTITNPASAGVKKYWVGGSGNWSDPAHWSLSSGGPSGVCIPTPNDTVIFNASSFSSNGQIVSVDLDAYCSVMDWTGANFNPQLFLIRNLIVRRKATLNPVMQVNRFSRNVQIQFLPVGQNVEFDSKRVLINADIVFEGQNLSDSLKLLNHLYLSDTSNFSMVRGTFITNNDSINAGAMVFLNIFPKTTRLGSSYIDLTYGWNSFTNATMTLNAGTSTIKVNGYNTFDYFYGDGLTYHNVIIGSPSDTNTFITGSNTFNNFTLLPGVDAKFTAGTTQTVNGLFSAIGNCTDSISMLSSAASPAIIHKASGTVSTQCVNYKGISRTGAATFNTLFSSNLGGNSGINFVSTPPTTANFTTLPDICLGDTAQFQNTSTSYLNGPVSYSWSFGDGDSSIVQNPDHYYNLAGNKIVTLTTTLLSNQCSSFKRDTVTVNSPFVFLSTNDNDLTICDGASVEFNASGLAGSLFQFTIDGVPLGPFSPVDSLVTSTLSDGQTVAVNVSLNGCEAPSPQYFQFTVNPSPLVNLASSASGDSLCVGSPVSFTASGAHLYRFFINSIPQGQFSSNPVFTSSSLSNGQVVSVVGKDTLSNCTRTGTPLHTMTVSPYPAPFMSRSAGPNICSGTQVVFTAGGASLYEFFINGISQGPLSANNIFTTSSLQNGDVVSLKGSTNNCLANSTSIFNFTVNPIPVVVLQNNAVNDSICAGETVTFFASGANTYQFFVNGVLQGPPSGSSSFSSAALQNGQVVSVTGTAAGCSATSTPNTIFVSPLPLVTLTSSDPDQVICLNQELTLTATGADFYEFFVNGVSQGPPLANNTFISDSIGNSQIVNVVGYQNTGCFASSVSPLSFTVLPAPTVNLYCSDADTTICFGESVTFTALGALNYEFFVDGISQGAASSQSTFFTSGLPAGIPQISVVGTGSNGCSASGQTDFNLVVNAIPQINLSSSDADNNICAGTPVTFYASGATNYQFFSNGTSQGPPSGTDSLQIMNLINGQLISVSGSQNGCIAVAPQPITMTVNAIPLVDIQSSDIDAIICAGSNVNFTGSGAAQYEFFLNGNSLAAPAATSVFSIDTLNNGDYVFLQGFSTSGCASLLSDTIQMVVNPLPQVQMFCSDPDTAICFSDAVSFNANGANLYQFLVNGLVTGAANTNGIFNTSVLNNNDDVSVVGTTINGCTAVSPDVFVFAVNSLPVPVLLSSDADNKICQGDTVIFTATGAATYEFFVDGVSQGVASALDSLITDSLQNFQVISITAFNNGCDAAITPSITMQVYTTPVVNLLSSATDTLICAGDDIVFTATGAIVNEFFIDGISQGPASANSIFTTSNLSSGQVVSVVGNNVVCPATAPQTYSYTVIPYPVVSVVSSNAGNSICFGENVVFTASGAASYQLLINGLPQGQSGPNNVFNLQNIENGDVISIQGFNASCGVISADSFAFVVNKMNLEMNAAPSWLVCDDSPVSITASGADAYQFFINGNATGAANPNNVLNLTNPANGDLIGLVGINNLSGCAQSIGLPYALQVENTPQIFATGNTVFCEGDSVLLTSTDSSGIQWYFNGAEIAGAIDEEYFAFADGLYSTTITRGGIGRVWSLGVNTYGQLGDSTTNNHSSPVLSGRLKQIVSLDAGNEFSLAVNDSGEVYAWGRNDFGQLGDGTFTASLVPKINGAIGNARKVAAGSHHSLVLLSNGTVLAYGRNTDGQLGNGGNNNTNFPQTISGLNNVVKIAAGEKHSLALLSDSTVWAWGDNQFGQLGNGSLGDQNLPVLVSGLTRIVSIACGAFHSLAVDADSNIFVWGSNAFGQLGLGTVNFVNVPVTLNLQGNFVDVAAGKEHSLLLNNQGRIYAMGNNQSGQLGNGFTVASNVPVGIGTPGNVKRVFAGPYNSFALRSDGSLWVWGDNADQQLAGGLGPVLASPTRRPEFTGASEVAGGMQHTAFNTNLEAACVSNVLTVTVQAAPAINIYDNATYLSTDPGVSYQWYLNNNPILNSNFIQQPLMGPGYYFVQVTYANGCIATSPVFSFQVGLEEVKLEDGIVLYPNPADAYVMIRSTGKGGIAQLSLQDCLGRLVLEKRVGLNTGKGEYFLNLEGIAKGSYLLNLLMEGGDMVVKKLILE